MPVPTHREIARACRVNNSTVSRALTGSPLIPEATRLRILEKARSMGWKPNPLVSACMAHRRASKQPQYQATIAYMVPSDEIHPFEQLPEYHRAHFEGAKKRAGAFGYGLEPFWPRDYPDNGKKLSRVLFSRGIPGIIFHGDSVTKERLSHFDWSAFAVATWGTIAQDFVLHNASSHYLHDIRLALKTVISYGYRRIALMLSCQQDDLADHAFASAFYYEQARNTSDLSYFTLPPYSLDPRNRRMLRSWIEQHQPDVIIGEASSWQTLADMKWKVPDRVAFVSLYCSKQWPQVGGIDQLPEIVGSNTVDLVTAQLVQNERGLPTLRKLLLSEGCWLDAASIPNRTKRQGLLSAISGAGCT